MAKKTVDRFGGLDVLINNAAIYYELRRVPWDSWTLDEFKNQYAVNVIGMWLCSKAVVPYMKKQGKGKIINLASGVVQAGQPLMLPYNCSKGGVMAMTTTLARELGDYNITVNAISPGWTLTEAALSAYGDKTEMFKERIRNMRCLKRDQVPEDMISIAVFLASDDSDFMDGQTISVDGGMTFRV